MERTDVTELLALVVRVQRLTAIYSIYSFMTNTKNAEQINVHFERSFADFFALQIVCFLSLSSCNLEMANYLSSRVCAEQRQF